MRRIFLFSILLVGIGAYSQTTVNGNVTGENGEPVPGANVVIVGKAIGTTSDFDGNFVLETSEVPPFQLRITSIGYSEATADITANNQTISVILGETQTF